MELVNGLYNVDKKQFADPYGNGVETFNKLANYMQIAVDGLGDNRSSAIEVGKALCLIREERLYFGYPVQGSKICVYTDFVEFCKAYFRCGKSTIYNYIALYEQFGAYGKKLVDKSLPSSFDVSKYTYTQLLLMLPLECSELNLVNPSMTCKEIKDYVKACEKVRTSRSGNSNQLENVANDEDLVVPVEEVEEFETFKLNNDECRKEFLTTYQRWNKCAECDVLNTHVTFYSICLVDDVYLVAVQTSYSTLGVVSYYMFNQSESNPYGGVYGRAHLDMRWTTSENEIIHFLRDKQIKSIDIAKR